MPGTSLSRTTKSPTSLLADAIAVKIQSKKICSSVDPHVCNELFLKHLHSVDSLKGNGLYLKYLLNSFDWSDRGPSGFGSAETF